MDGVSADVHLAATDRVLDRRVLGVKPDDLVGGTGRDELQIALDGAGDVFSTDHAVTLHGSR